MLVVGLTGGISSGKSMVSTWFCERNITVLDSDKIVKELQSPHSELLMKMGQVFGAQIFLEDGSLNRKLLAKLIFHDQRAKQQLNDLIHPKVKERLLQGIEQAKRLGKKMIVLDIPLLYESQFESLIDICIVVYVSKDIQIKRLMKRDQISKNYALAKIKAQLPLDEKKERADIILNNNGSLDQLKSQFNTVLIELEKITLTKN